MSHWGEESLGQEGAGSEESELGSRFGIRRALDKYFTSGILCYLFIETTIILSSLEHPVDSIGSDRMEGVRDGALEAERSRPEL